MHLKFNSVAKEIGRIRVPLDDVSSFYEFNEPEGGLRMSENELMLISWADRAYKELKKLKNERAKELVDEYDETVSVVIDEIEDRTLPEKYRVVNTYSGKTYLVFETIEEIEEQKAILSESHRLGIYNDNVDGDFT